MLICFTYYCALMVQLYKYIIKTSFHMYFSLCKKLFGLILQCHKYMQLDFNDIYKVEICVYIP